MGVRWGRESKRPRECSVCNRSLPGQSCGKAQHLEKSRAGRSQGARGAGVLRLGERSLTAWPRTTRVNSREVKRRSSEENTGQRLLSSWVKPVPFD